MVKELLHIQTEKNMLENIKMTKEMVKELLHGQAEKKSWAFSNLVSFCKIHLFNYIHLLLFLENPDKDWYKTAPPKLQYDLF